MNGELEKYYTYLKSQGVDIAPTFESFQSTLSNDSDATKYYDYLRKNNVDVAPTFESFQETLGLKKKDTSTSNVQSVASASDFIPGSSPSDTKEPKIPFVEQPPQQDAKEFIAADFMQKPIEEQPMSLSFDNPALRKEQVKDIIASEMVKTTPEIQKQIDENAEKADWRYKALKAIDVLGKSPATAIEGVKEFDKSLIGLGTGILKTLAIGGSVTENALLRGKFSTEGVDKDVAYRVGKWADDMANDLFTEDKKYSNEYVNELAAFAPIMLVGGISSAAKGAELINAFKGPYSRVLGEAKQHLPAAMTIGASAAANAHDEAKMKADDAKTISKEEFINKYSTAPENNDLIGQMYEDMRSKESGEVAWSAAKRAFIDNSLPFALPVAGPSLKILNDINKASGNTLTKTIVDEMRTSGVGGAIQLSLVQLMSNKTAQDIYDYQRGILDGVLKSGVTGLVLNTLIGASTRALKQIKSQTPIAKDKQILNDAIKETEQIQEKYKDLDEVEFVQDNNPRDVELPKEEISKEKQSPTKETNTDEVAQATQPDGTLEQQQKEVRLPDAAIEPAEYTQYVLDKSDNIDEIYSAYSQERDLAPRQVLQPWQEFVLDQTTTKESYARFGDRNNITPAIKGKYLRRTGLPVDEIARIATEEYGREVTPDMVVDFMTNNTTNRKTTDVQKGLARKYKALTGESIKNHLKNKQGEQEISDDELFSITPKVEESKISDATSQPREIKERFMSIANEVRAGKIDKDIAQVGIPFAKEVWNGAIETMAKTIELTGDVAQAIADGVKYIKTTDWYKSLSDNEKRKWLNTFREQTGSYPRKGENIEIDKNKQQVRKYIKNNEYTNQHLPYAKDMSGIPMKQLNRMPDDLYRKVYATMSDLANKKVSDVKNLESTYREYNKWKESIYDDKMSNEVVQSEYLDDVSKIIEKSDKLKLSDIRTFDDIINYKRQNSLLERQILDLLDREGLTYEDGLIINNAKEEVSKYKSLQDFLNETYEFPSDKELINEINDANNLNLSEEKYKELESGVKDNMIEEGRDRISNIDYSAFDESYRKYIKEFLDIATPEKLKELSLSDVDSYNKIMEQLTYGNAPKRIVDIRNEIIKNDIKRVITNNVDLVKRNSALWDKFSQEGSLENLTSAIAKKYLTDIDSDYGTSKDKNRLFYEFINIVIAKDVDKADYEIQKQIDKRIGYNAKRWAGKRKSKQEIYEREVGMLGKLLNHQLNLTDNVKATIEKTFGVKGDDARNWFKLMYETPKGEEIFSDRNNTRLTYDDKKYDIEAYNNLKKRNGGKDIIVDEKMSDDEIINTVGKKLLNKNQFKHFKNLYEGYKEQLLKQKENAIRQGVTFSERRMYFPDKVLDKTNNQYDDGKSFLEGLSGKRHIITKSGNVNPKTDLPHFVDLNATRGYKRYVRTNFMDYYLRDSYNNMIRAFNEAAKESKDPKEIEYITSILKGLKTRMMSQYGEQPIDFKLVNFANQYARIPIMAPTRLGGEALSNPFRVLARANKPGEYIFNPKLHSSEHGILNRITNELGIDIEAGGRYTAELGEVSTTTKRMAKRIGMFDDMARMRILYDGFTTTFKDITGEDFNLESFNNDAGYKKQYQEAYDKSLIEAKYRYEQNYPTGSKFSEYKYSTNGGKVFHKINRVMMTYSMREASVLLRSLRDVATGDNEGRLQAAKNIGGIVASNTMYGAWQYYKRALYLGAAAGVYNLFDDEVKTKEALNKANKVLTERNLGSVILSEGLSTLLSTPLSTFGNLGRDGLIAVSSIINNYAQGRKLTPEIKDKLDLFNTFMQEQFYVRPVLVEGFGSRREMLRNVSNALPTFSKLTNDAVDAGIDVFDIIDKASRGEKLSQYEAEIYSITKLANNILFGVAFGVPFVSDASAETNNLINSMMGVSKKYEGDVKKLQGTPTKTEKKTPEEKSAKTLKNIAEKEQLSKELGIEYIKNKSEAKELIKHPETRAEGRSALRKIMEEKRRKKEKLND